MIARSQCISHQRLHTVGKSIHAITDERPDLPKYGVGSKRYLPKTGHRAQQEKLREQQARRSPEQVEIRRDQPLRTRFEFEGPLAPDIRPVSREKVPAPRSVPATFANTEAHAAPSTPKRGAPHTP